MVARQSDDKTSGHMRQQLAKISTGEDAIAFFSRYGGSSDVKLLYCNPAPAADGRIVSPWDLVVVNERAVQPEHFTISARGVVHFRPGQLSECTPISQWVQQCMRFRVLASMSFFRLFTKRKKFMEWQDGARHEVFCRHRQRLAQECFLAKPLFAGRLLEMKAVVSAAELATVVLQLPPQCCQLEDFATKHLSLFFDPQTGAQQALEHYGNSLEGALEDLVSSVKLSVEAAFRPPQSKTFQPRKALVQEKQEAKDRQHRQQVAHHNEKKLGHFIQLVEYMFQSALLSLLLSAVQRLHRQVAVSQEHKKLFYVSARLQSSGHVLEPPLEVFQQVLGRLWRDMIKVVEAVPQASNDPRFDAYAILGRECQQISNILARNVNWQSCTEGILRCLGTQLLELQTESAKVFEPYRRIHEFALAWDESAFSRQAHSFKSLSGHMTRMTEFQEALNGFRVQRQLGVLVLDWRSVKESLAPLPERGLSALRPVMLAFAREQITASFGRTKHLIRELDKRPTDCSGLEELARVIKVAGEEQRAVQTSLEECIAMHRLLRQQAVRPPVDDQVLLDSFVAKEQELFHESLPAAIAYLAQQRRKADLEIVSSFSFDAELNLEIPAAILVNG